MKVGGRATRIVLVAKTDAGSENRRIKLDFSIRTIIETKNQGLFRYFEDPVHIGGLRASIEYTSCLEESRSVKKN